MIVTRAKLRLNLSRFVAAWFLVVFLPCGARVYAQSCPSYVPANSTCVPVGVVGKEWLYFERGGWSDSEEGLISQLRAEWNGFGCPLGAGWSTDAPDAGLDEWHGGFQTLGGRRYSATTYSNYPYCEADDEPTSWVYAWSLITDCPEGYVYISDSSDTHSICYRARDGQDVDPIKDLGVCAPGAPPQSPDPPEQCPFVGDSVNAATGNKLEREQDYVGHGVFPLEFTRYYNSQNSSPGHQQPTSVRDSKYFGLGWSASYFQYLYVTPYDGVTYVVAYRPDGRGYRFSGTASTGPYQSDADANLSLSRLSSGWQLTLPDGVVENYGTDGRLLSVRARRGGTHWLSYSGSRLSSVHDDFGNTLQFEYSTSGSNASISALVDPSGERIQYDTSANLRRVTTPDLVYHQYQYRTSDASPHLLVGVIDENASTYSSITYELNSDDGVVKETSLAGGVSHYVFSPDYNLGVQVTEPLGNNLSVSVTPVLGSKKIQSIESDCVDSSCPWSSREYDENGNVISKGDGNGVITSYRYNSRGLEISRTEAYGTSSSRTIDTQWHPTFRLPIQIDEPGRRATFTYDSNGTLLTRTIRDIATNESRTWTYTYDSFGHVLTADGPRTDVSDVTTFTYYNCNTGYECGQVQTITDALGHPTTYNTYNAHGQPLSITDPNGIVTTVTYNARQQVTSRTVGVETASFEYWPTGLLKKTSLPDGSALLYTYDAAHRLTDIHDGSGNHIHYTLDAAGNRTGEDISDVSTSLTRTRTQVFDLLNQLSQVLGSAGGPSATTFQYDSNGNQTSVAAPLARTELRTYDELNRLTSSTDPNWGTTSYSYNGLDQLISVTDPRYLTTTYTYNALGDLKQTVSTDTGSTTNTFDSGGNLKTTTDARGAVATYTYDALNRVKTASFKKGSTIDQTLTYSYDAGMSGIGQMTSAGDANHSMSWTYDAQRRVLGKSQTIGTITKAIAYGYTNGQLTSITTPSNQSVVYGYTDGLVTSVSVNGTTILSGAIYDPFGPLRQWTWGNGTLSVRTYDQDGRLTQLDSAGLSTYSYDDASRLIGITDTTAAENSWVFDYDVLDRLISAGKTGTSIAYTYDENGNRLTQSGSSSSTYNVAPASNRLKSVVGALTRTYGYDASGHVTSTGSRTFAYYNNGRMKSETTGSTTVSYTYNALGQRIKKTGTARLFYYDEAGHLIGEYDGSGNLVQETIWLGDTPVATLRPNGAGIDIFYVHTDHLNAPRKVTRPFDNKVRWSFNPDPFGNGAPNENPQSLGTFSYNLRYPGQYYDSESGLNYNYYRDYEAATGRYVESDPIGLRGGVNTYAYVGANPLASVDPSGLVKWSGNVFSFVASAPFGAAYVEATLYSECVGGKRDKIEVTGVGPAAGAGVKVSAAVAEISFDDHETSLNPMGFDGDFTMGSAAVTVGAIPLPPPNLSRIGLGLPGLGIGVGYIQFGRNFSDPLPPGFIVGRDMSITGAVGSATVTSVTPMSCGCQSK